MVWGLGLRAQGLRGYLGFRVAIFLGSGIRV
jgi:hypothetical protein